MTLFYTLFYSFHLRRDDHCTSWTTKAHSLSPLLFVKLTLILGSFSASNAFLLPQWGGIVILNPSAQATPMPVELSPATLDSIFTTFSDHLLTLLGIPKLPPSLTKRSSAGHNILTDWQLDALLRHRSLENAQGSQDTLQSIVKLVDQIENMPVGQDVKGDVQEALVAIEKVCSSLTQTIKLSLTLLIDVRFIKNIPN
jgi:hypothetical protein